MSARFVNVFIVKYATSLGWGYSGVYASEAAVFRTYKEVLSTLPLDGVEWTSRTGLK